MNNNLSTARLMAAQAHAYQVDKAGEPYFFHCVRVALAVPMDLRIPALLHDTLEDTNLTADEIEREFGNDVLQTVVRLTRTPFEGYEEYIREVNEHPMARQIKIADLYDNLNHERLYAAAKNGADIARLFVKYSRALRTLKQQSVASAALPLP